ncbi:MAG TPA: MaoC/PaaZ C-terminal domain-containing protein [Stellaceae bacterium]|nr:MaoC/PaaZ C-terminal domain-containing protein [Stellaceae bacterium]
MTSHALYFEDFEPGQEFISSARTITEADLTIFAMLSGDWNPVHVDEEFAKASAYGKRVVHGLYGPAIMTGFLQQLGIFDGSAIAMLNISQLNFLKPLLVGDTVHMRLTILDARPTKDGTRGVVGRKFRLVKHGGEVAQEMLSDVLVRRRPDTSTPETF